MDVLEVARQDVLAPGEEVVDRGAVRVVRDDACTCVVGERAGRRLDDCTCEQNGRKTLRRCPQERRRSHALWITQFSNGPSLRWGNVLQPAEVRHRNQRLRTWLVRRSSPRASRYLEF